jgi:hypothetical protein
MKAARVHARRRSKSSFAPTRLPAEGSIGGAAAFARADEVCE